MRYRLLRTVSLLGLIGATAASGLARVVRIEVESREDVLGGRAFGPAGPYERLTGVVHFEFDPTNPVNVPIIDIDRAPGTSGGWWRPAPTSWSCDRSDRNREAAPRSWR